MKRQAMSMLGVLIFTAAACGPQEQGGVEARQGLPELHALTTQLEGDTTPPESSTFTDPAPNEDGDYYGQVSVTITSTDDASGVESITYSLSGAQTGGATVEGDVAYVPIINTLGTTTVTYYAKDVAGNYEPSKTLTINLVPQPPPCKTVSLRDFNVFVAGDYTGGTDVRGKVAAGGDITMEHYSVGAELPADDIENVLVAGGSLNIKHGGIFGNAHYGTTTTADGTSTFYRGALSAGSPIDFEYRAWDLGNLSSDLAYGRSYNGTTRVESWGGLFLEGTDPEINVFYVDASTFASTVYMSINAPGQSTVLVNVFGSEVQFANFSTDLYGGIDAGSVLYNFVDAWQIAIWNYGFRGTILAPYAHIDFTSAAIDGGIYAASMSGNGEGHLYPLRDFQFCGSGDI